MRSKESMHSRNCCNESFCGVQDVLESFARVVNFDVQESSNRVCSVLSDQSCLATNQIIAGCCRMWRVVVLVSAKSVHVACFTGSRQSHSFATNEVMFMVLHVLYSGFSRT